MNYRVEKEQYEFLSKDFTAPASRIYRIGINGRRYYYEYIDGKPIIYASGTTLISDGYPDNSKGMEEWRVKMRVMGENPDEFAQYRANYGTIMHILFGHYLTGIKIPLHDLDKYIRNLKGTFIADHDIDALMKNNLEELQKDMLAFAQWVKDYNVKPLAIELMMRSVKYQVATAVDLVCNLDITEEGYFGEVYKSGERKGEPKLTKRPRTVIGIVDFKSGKKGFYDKHAIQLLLNKKIVEENYPNIKIEALYNFSPKDWRTNPGYNFTDQSNNNVLDELEEILSIGKKRHLKKNKSVTVYKGILDITSDFDYSKNYDVQDIDYFISNIREEEVVEEIGEEVPKFTLDMLVENEKITTALELRIFLNRLAASSLKDMGKLLGIKYSKKQDFIKKLNELYLDGKK